MNYAGHGKQLTSYMFAHGTNKMSHRKFSISSLLHTDFQNTSNYFSKNTTTNYLCPQGMVLGSKQMLRQNCRICNSQINHQYHLLWNHKCNSYTKEAPLPHKRFPPGGDPYTACCRWPLPSRQILTPPCRPQGQPSLAPWRPSLPICRLGDFPNQRQIENAQEDYTPSTNLPKKIDSILGTNLPQCPSCRLRRRAR